MRESIEDSLYIIEKICFPETYVENEHSGEYRVIAKMCFKLKQALEGEE